LSGGAYDVTIKPLTTAYGFAGKERDYKVNIDSLLQFVGMDKVSIENGRLVKTDERVALDFNSIAKGYTVDLAANELEQMGVENYIVDIGGEVRCKGINKKGVAWRVGVETPFDGNQSNGEFIQQVISLSNCSMATSGNYRRYYLDDEGRKVAHTIDPRTGQSVISELLSATVIAPTCAEADAYGTMFMALGKEAAIELARRMSEQGVYVYFITSGRGDDFEVYYSSQLESKLSHSDGFNAL
jgi:thiamine biosynthesis lipoprotein